MIRCVYTVFTAGCEHIITYGSITLHNNVQANSYAKHLCAVYSDAFPRCVVEYYVELTAHPVSMVIAM